MFWGHILISSHTQSSVNVTLVLERRDRCGVGHLTPMVRMAFASTGASLRALSTPATPSQELARYFVKIVDSTCFPSGLSDRTWSLNSYIVTKVLVQ